jgi:hypothetical protein
MNRIVFLGQGSGGARTDLAQADLAVAACYGQRISLVTSTPEAMASGLTSQGLSFYVAGQPRPNLPESLF